MPASSSAPGWDPGEGEPDSAEPCARHSGGLLGSLQEVLDGQAILTKAVNPGLDLELPYLTAKDIDISNARHRQKTRGHAPVD